MIILLHINGTLTYGTRIEFFLNCNGIPVCHLWDDPYYGPVYGDKRMPYVIPLECVVSWEIDERPLSEWHAQVRVNPNAIAPKYQGF